MRVLMISFDATMLGQGQKTPGDTQERHCKYARALRQQSSDGCLTILVKTPPGTSNQPITLSEALMFYPVPCPRWAFPLQAMQTAQQLFAANRFDLITTQSPFDDGLLGVWLQRRFGAPLNVQMRASFLDLGWWIKERPVVYRMFNMLGKWVSSQAKTIRVVSYGEKDRLDVRFPKLRGKIFALPPLVNVDTFHKPVQPDERAQVQQFLQQSGREALPFFLFVGRLAPQKNLSTLLHAFAAVCKKNPQVTLVIAGDGPLRPQLQQLAQHLAIAPQILWLGNIRLQALRGWYASARGMILPSFYEGVAKVIPEAFLCGTPVIAAPFVCAPELIQDGETGFVAKSFTDPEEFATRMLAWLDSPECAQTMGQKGKEHILQYLLPDEIYMERLLAIWQKTAEK